MTEHYYTSEPAGTAERRTLLLDLGGERVSVQTAGGVFSPDRVDLGTGVLLREAPPPPPAGIFLDLGCGWGPLALTMARLAPRATVWAVDVNRRALDLVARNAASLGLGGICPAEPGHVPADARFDLIWSNPPIRVGKAVLHDLMRTWLPRLSPGGAAYLVVQRHLGSDSLHRWLDTELGPASEHRLVVTRHASAKGYRVLKVSAPA